MTTPRRGVGLTPMETRRDLIVRTALLAEELGYEIFALPEGWGLDAVPVLTEIAVRTARINLASGILSVWGRTPATLAMTAATLHQVSGGRYVLGLGASTKALTEGFHDIAFEHPAAKLRDVVTRVRALLAGQPAQLGNAAAARPLRLGQPPAPEVPIWVAALGRHTTRVAAELGDGWIPIFVSSGRFARGREELPPHVTPAVTVPAHVGPKERLYAHLRRRYSGISEHVVDRYCVAGTPDECLARVREYVDAGAQHIVFNLGEAEDAERLAEVVRAAAG